MMKAMKRLKLKSQRRLFMTTQGISSKLTPAISQNLNGLKKQSQHQSKENIHPRKLLIDVTLEKQQLVMFLISLTSMLIMIN